MKQSNQLLILLLSVILFSQCASVKSQKLADRNKETVRIWFEEGWNKDKNVELLERCFDPQWTDGNPLLAGQVMGYDGMKQLIEDYKKGATNAHFTITHLFANETQAVVRYEVIATHSGDFFGIPATGKEFTSTGLVLYEMKEGRIAVSWQELDLTGILNQLRQ